MNRSRPRYRNALNVIQFIGWLFVHNLMVLPIFLFAFLHLHSSLIQIIAALMCTLIGVATILLLARHYANTLSANNTAHFALEWLTRERIWKWGVTLLITIIWISVERLWPGQVSADQSATEGLLSAYPIPMFIVVIVLGPIYEELLCRGLFFTYFVRSKTRWAHALGLVVSTILFGLLHSTTPSWTTLGYIFSGFVLGGLYLITRNIRFSILAHMISNVLAAVW